MGISSSVALIAMTLAVANEEYVSFTIPPERGNGPGEEWLTTTPAVLDGVEGEHQGQGPAQVLLGVTRGKEGSPLEDLVKMLIYDPDLAPSLNEDLRLSRPKVLAIPLGAYQNQNLSREAAELKVNQKQNHQMMSKTK